MTNHDYAEALRRIAQVYDDNPGIQLPYQSVGSVPLTVYVHTKPAFQALVRAFGPGEKAEALRDDPSLAGLLFRPDLARPIAFEIHGFKSGICERVQVETRLVPEVIIPAQEAMPAQPERVIPAHEEPVYDWVCEPFLGDAVETAKHTHQDAVFEEAA